MNCCPEADFRFLDAGLCVSERNTQAEGYTMQIFPYKSIQTVRYTYTRGDGGIVSIWLKDTGLSYRYAFPCGETGKAKFEELLEKL